MLILGARSSVPRAGGQRQRGGPAEGEEGTFPRPPGSKKVTIPCSAAIVPGTIEWTEDPDSGYRVAGQTSVTRGWPGSSGTGGISLTPFPALTSPRQVARVTAPAPVRNFCR